MSPDDWLELPAAGYLIAVALLLGSFINMAVDRFPRGESLVSPRSHCRTCDRTLNLIDLLPVAGYFLRGGRCATCRTPIGISSPLIEAATGACMAGSLAWLGPWPGAFAGFALIAVLGVAVVGLSVARYRAATATGR